MPDIYDTYRMFGIEPDLTGEPPPPPPPEDPIFLEEEPFNIYKMFGIEPDVIPQDTIDADSTNTLEDWKELSRQYAASIPSPLTTTEKPDDMSWMGRFFRNIFEGAVPWHIESKIPEAESSAEVWADALGTIIGVPVGMLPFAAVTGGYGAVVTGPKKLKAAHRAYKLIQHALDLGRQGSKVRSANTFAKAKKIVEDAGIVGEAASVYRGSGFLGLSQSKLAKSYRDMYRRFGSGETQWSSALAKLHKNAPGVTAKAVDLGLRNLGAFNLYGQAKVAYPWQLKAEERLNALTADSMTAILFSVAGLPTAGIASFVKGAGAKRAVNTLEPFTLLGAGMFGGDIGAWSWGTESPTWEDRIIHGLSLVGFHYARKGLGKVEVGEKMRASLRAMGADESTINRWEMGITQTIPDSIFKFLNSGDGRKYANVFKDKDTGKTVDLISITKPKKEEGQYLVVYKDNTTKGEYHTIRGKSLESVKGKFFGMFEKVPIEKEIQAAKKIDKPKDEVRETQELSRDKLKAVKQANKKTETERTYEIKPSSRKVEDKSKESSSTKRERLKQEEGIKTLKTRKATSQEKQSVDADSVLDFGTTSTLTAEGTKWFIKKEDTGPSKGWYVARKDGSKKWIKVKSKKGDKITPQLKGKKNLMDTLREIELSKLEKHQPIENTITASLSYKGEKTDVGKLGRRIFTEEELTFNDTKQGRRRAKEFAERRWVQGKDLLKLEENLQAGKEKYGDKYKKYEQLKGSAYKNERQMKLSREEAESLRLEFDTNSGGSMENMSVLSLMNYRRTLEGRNWLAGRIKDKHGEFSDGAEYLLGVSANVPVDIMSHLGRKWHNSKTWAFKMVLPFSTVLSMTKSRAYSLLGFKVEMHELERQIIASKGLIFRKEQMKKHGLTKGEFNQLSPYIDPKFKVHENKKLTDKLGKRKINEIKKDFKEFSDYMFAQLVDAGVEVRFSNSRKSGPNEGSFYEPLFAAYEKKGGRYYKIELHRSYFRSDVKGKYGNKIFQLINWQGKTSQLRRASPQKVKNKEGNIVTVAKVEHHYTKGYLTRSLSKDFKSDYFGIEGMSEYLTENLINKDEFYIRRAAELWQEETAGKGPMSQEKVERIQERVKEDLRKIASDDISMFNQYAQHQLPIGSVHLRTADFPPAILLEKVTNADGKSFPNVINVPVKDVMKYKKGDVVTVDGKQHKVSKVVKVYENKIDNILDSYLTNVSQIIPTYRHFGRSGSRSRETRTLLRQGAVELGDGGSMSKWADKYITAKINGAAKTTAAKFMQPFTNIIANIGLSSPFAGYKNFMLQGVQNTSTLGYLTFTKGWLNYLSNDAINFMTRGKYRDSIYKKLATETGALQIGVHDLLKGRAWNFNPGLMKQTERLNRYTTVAIADVMLENALKVLTLGNKAPRMARLMVSEQRASHMMRKFFGFDQVQINNMIDIMKNNQGSGSLNNPLLWIPKKLRMQALQKAHLTTAGGPTLHTMPGWMSKDWARPLTLFYRTAYQVTNNVVGNVMRPLFVEGNPFPMARYIVGSALTGASIYYWQHQLLGKDVVNRFQNADDDFWQYFIRGEGLGLGSTMFDEYGSGLEGFLPAIARTAESIYILGTEAFQGLRGRGSWETAGLTINEALRLNVVAYNHALEVLDTHDFKVPFFKEKVNARRLKKREKEVRRLRNQFMEEYYSEEPNSDNKASSSERSPYYTMMRTSFWAKDMRTKAQTYYSALQFIMNEDKSRVLKGQYSPRASEKAARDLLKSIVTKENPIPDSWMKRFKGERVSKYRLFLSRLTSEEAKEVEDMIKMYKYQKQEWDRALMKHRQWNFK